MRILCAATCDFDWRCANGIKGASELFVGDFLGETVFLLSGEEIVVPIAAATVAFVVLPSKRSDLEGDGQTRIKQNKLD